MGIATPTPQLGRSHLSPSSPWVNSGASMSHSFHQDIFSFSDGFDRAASQDQHHLSHHSRRDKLRPVHGFDPLADAKGDESLSGIYDSPAGAANMLSEMFSFPAPGPSSADLLASQLPGSYRLPERPSGFSSDWYGSNRDSAAAMQLFLRSPSPSTTLHHQQAFQAASSFGAGDPSFSGAVVEGQGLSLSLSSSLQRLEVAKAQELRARADEMGAAYFEASQQQSSLHFVHQGQQGQGVGQLQHMGYGSAGLVNVLRNSKYARAARELLEEFCSVSRGQLKRKALGGSANPNASHGGGGASSSAVPAGSSSSKGLPLPSSSSPADRFEQQRKKAKLLSMLDEVDRRYSHYCDQMQTVVSSFDSVMGFGAATPYTALARKAMSRHFRCLKDLITGELKQICELLGEKDTAGRSGITRSETPRLKFLDQSLRQQRAFHQMGIMDQEAWRPPRGLPERSVSILRAWLFDHFLHPYPSDADKHLLARQTGLSRNQVSNWFINARVRLWKPMVEEIYQQESKQEEENNKGERAQPSHQTPQTRPSPTSQQHHQRPETNAPENDSSSIAGPRRSEAHQSGATATALVGPTSTTLGAAARMRLAAAGDVSLTLGLRHSGNAAAGQEENPFSVRDFRSC